MKTKEKIKYLTNTIVEHGAVRALDAATTFVLIRNLNIESLSTFIFFQSWVGILLLFFPSFENILYRDYHSIRQSEDFGHILKIFQKINFYKIIIAFVLIFITVWFASNQQSFSLNVSAYVLAFSLPLSQAIYGSYKEPMRFELKTSTILFLTILQKTILLIAVYWATKSFNGAILPVNISAILVFIIFGIIWNKTFNSHLNIANQTTSSFKDIINKTKELFSSTVLWIHLNGSIATAIQTLDVFFLNYLQSDLKNAALYGVALKGANFLQLIPLPFAQVYSVYISRKSKNLKTKVEINKQAIRGTTMFLLLALVMLFLGNLFSYQIIEFLAKGKFNAQELTLGEEYFKWQLYGTAILILCYGVGAIINCKAKLKKVTLNVHIPWLIFSVFGYFWAASTGTLTAAKFNVAIYALCTFLHFIFYIRWVNSNEL